MNPYIELFALKYGASEFRSSLIFADGDEQPLPIAWYFWLLRCGDALTLIDTGLSSPDLLRAFGIRHYQPPSILLWSLGIEPSSVSRVVLTHLHADHVDGLQLFSDAEVVVQRRELEAMTRALALNPALDYAGGYNRRHALELDRRRRRGTLRVTDGDEDLGAGIRVVLAPFHTAGTQSVVAEVGQQTFTLVPDNAYVSANVDANRPVGVAVDTEGNKTYLASLASSGTVVIPGHDPALLDRFERINEHVVRLAASPLSGDGEEGAS